MIVRRLQKNLQTDLKKKMVLLAGPRQCGKTTLSKQICKPLQGQYYNWDDDEDRHKIVKKELNPDVKLWVFDELHKFKRWRNYLKGLYDTYSEKYSILVTGSAHLGLNGRGGESLQGRYYFHRLHPFTLSELTKTEFPNDEIWLKDTPERTDLYTKNVLKTLMQNGGFPEPFLASAREAMRWRLNYGQRLVREEVRQLEMVQDLHLMEMLFDRLGILVGSPLSINSLREDLQVAHETVAHWLLIFEKLYAIFRISPYGPASIKAVKKEQKLYFWDWARVEDEATRFENLIAMHLLRFVHWLEDVEGEKAELRYFRNTVGHEVDFILLRKNKPWLAVEVKIDDRPLSKGLNYFLNRVKVESAIQLSLHGNKHALGPIINGCQVTFMNAASLLCALP